MKKRLGGVASLTVEVNGKIQRGDTTMGNNTVVSLKKPAVIDDLLTETLWSKAVVGCSDRSGIS